MDVPREEFRYAVLGDGVDEWHPLAVPEHFASTTFGPKSTELGGFVASLYRELLVQSTIAIAPEPRAGRHPRSFALREGQLPIAHSRPRKGSRG